MNEKQQQLTFDKGITNVPSDALCSDNALAESVGMVYDDGEHRVIQKPREKMTASDKLLFVHKIPGGETVNYIYLKTIAGTPTTYEVWSTSKICDGAADVKVEAIGKTLILNIGGVSHYAVWKNNTYLYLRNMLPEVEMKFWMSDAKAWKKDAGQTGYDYPPSSSFEYGTKTVDIYSHDDGTIDSHDHISSEHNIYWTSEIKKQEQFNDAIVGIVSAHLNDIKKIKRFCFPFWVRYAVRLYDGSHTCISNPILMMPTVHYNRRVYFSASDMDYLPINHNSEIWPATYDPYSAKLNYQIVSYPDSLWNDIVKGVDVFVSEEVKSFDINANWRLINPFDTERASTILKESINANDGSASTVAIDATDESIPDNKAGFTTYIMPQQWSDDEFKKRLIEASRFYKLIEIDSDKFDYDAHDSGLETPRTDTNDVVIDSMTLPNLTTQTQLEYDDYFSHTNMAANVMKVYNSRLHLADISRSFFNGFGHFSNAIKSSSSVAYDICVYINTDDGERIVKKSVSATKEDLTRWFYYPDPRAYKAEIYFGGSYYSFKLKEHPGLNGAYIFNGLPYSGNVDTLYIGSASTIGTVDPERIVNRVFVSEVNNPWLFTSKGDVTVGNAKIVGMATQTMALGQEEHGIHPLTVFTESGVYALKLNSEGIYLVSDLFSREVCANAKSITETDGAVFFASDKGLMVVVGSQVKCVSEQLSGKTNTFKDGNNVSLITDLGNFCDFLKTCIIAYDYRDSLLWLFNKTSTICYIYSIKSGTFSKYNFGTGNVINNVVNAYPDYLLQDSAKVYSLIERDDINVEAATAASYTGRILTRPMKLENALALKSIMQIRHIKDMQGSITLRLFASNNLDNWVELPSLRGTPWKYYRFCYDFANLKATDRFAGTMLITQERRTNKLR